MPPTDENVTLDNGGRDAGTEAPSEETADTQGAGQAETAATPAGGAAASQDGESAQSAQALDLDKLTPEQALELVEQHHDAILAKVDPRSALGRLATVAKERREAREALAAAQRELESRAAKPPTAADPGSAPPPGLDPYLHGKVAEYDPTDGQVRLEPDGNWLHQREAKMMLQAQEVYEAYMRERSEAQARAQLEEYRRAVEQGEAQVMAEIAKARASIPALAAMDESRAKEFDGHVKSRFEAAVADYAARNAGPDGTPDYSQLTDEVLRELIQAAAKAEADYAGYAANLQLAAKSKAAETAPLPGSGTASLPAGKPMHELTEDERRAAIEATMRRAMAKLGS